jgi:hypothetical protein
VRSQAHRLHHLRQHQLLANSKFQDNNNTPPEKVALL